MNGEKLSIFLSHSHADIDKVRKIRDVLETLECEPLIFFLKCLDDDNDTLEDFIKREIEKRSLFLYCKSENAEKSVWVKKELEYIRSFDKSRVYTVDIDGEFSSSLLKFLAKLTEILKENRIFISYSHEDLPVADAIINHLKKCDYGVYEFRNLNSVADGWREQLRYALDKIADEGVFVFLVSENSAVTAYTLRELQAAINRGVLIISVFIEGSENSGTVKALLERADLYKKLGSAVSANPTPEQLEALTKLITEGIESRKKHKYDY